MTHWQVLNGPYLFHATRPLGGAWRLKQPNHSHTIFFLQSMKHTHEL